MIKLPSLFSVLLAFGLALPSAAQTSGVGEQAKDPKVEQPKDPKAEQKKDPKIEEYEKAVKDLKKFEGDFTFYIRKKDILLELPEDRIGKLFLLQASFNTGAMADGLAAGFPVGDFVIQPFRFDRQEDQVWLMRPNVNYRWADEDMLAVAAKRQFPEAILASYRIEQQNPEKKLLLINVTSLFFGDPIRLSEGVTAMLGGPYSLDREKSGVESIKSFPQNCVVQMRMHFFSPRGGGGENPIAALLGLGGSSHLEDDRSAPIKVSFNLWFRKDTGYMARLADPRVGYFTQDFFSLAKFLNDDRTERYINRMQIRKKDSKLPMSEPEKPIVWYVDTSVPAAYRDAVKEGILLWNRAFEEVGIKNAIVVKQAPDNDPDWDHADGRFNVVRWSVSEESAYAIAMARTDPFTGEILNASVNIDANMLYAAFREQERVAVPGSKDLQRALQVLTYDPKRDDAMRTDAYLWEPEKLARDTARRERMAKLGWHTEECSFAEGAAATAAFAWKGIEAMGGYKISKDAYAKEFLRESVAHEVGHCFGLRHNFIASTRLTTDELADDAMTNRLSTTASVMDYNPVNIQAVLTKARNYYAPKIGEYDEWAIKYGYMEIADARTPLGEKYALSQIAGQSGLRSHRYMGDEQADSFDPYVVRFDNARDPVRYSAKVLEAASNIKQYAIDKLPKQGESYGKRTEFLMSAITRVFREGRTMARFVGGVSGNKNFKGDLSQGPTLAPVSAEDQRLAVRLIAKYCFSPSSFSLPESVLMNMSMNPNNEASSNWTAPLRDQISAQAGMLYVTLMSAGATKRIAENEYKWGANPKRYTMAEHFGTLLGAVFSEIGEGKSVPPIRRDLQRFAINGLTVQAGASQGGVSEDVRMLASDSLRRLSKRFGDQLSKPKGLDQMTLVHLRDSKETIDRFLARTQTVTR